MSEPLNHSIDATSYRTTGMVARLLGAIRNGEKVFAKEFLDANRISDIEALRLAAAISVDITLGQEAYERIVFPATSETDDTAERTAEATALDEASDRRRK